MNKFEKDLTPKEQFVQNFLDEFEKWAEKNPLKTNLTDKDLLSPNELTELYFSEKRI